MECNGSQTCRCSQPKVDAYGLCFDCCEKAGIDFKTGEIKARCEVVLPPTAFDVSTKVSVFLAGSIDQGKAPNWSLEVANCLKDVDCVVLNPRRDDWDSSWKQEIENPEFREQVEWELRGLEQSSVIALCFTKESQAPISLLELGLHVADGKMLVFCPEGYWRKGNVDVVCNKYHVRVYEDFKEFCEAVKARMLVEKGVKMGTIQRLTAGDKKAWRKYATAFVVGIRRSDMSSSRSRHAVSVDFNEMMRKRYAPHIPSFTAGENHKDFDTKKEALAFLEDHALMSVGWKEGSKQKVAIYWNGKLNISDADKKQWWVKKADDQAIDPMAGEKLSSLFLKLHTWATRKATSLPPGAPVVTQILDGLNAVEEALKGKMGLTGKAAVGMLLRAAEGNFTLDAPPFPALIKKYGVKAMREAAGRFFASKTSGMGDTYPVGALRGRPDYGERDGDVGNKMNNMENNMPVENVTMGSDNFRVQVIVNRMVKSAKQFMA